MVTTIVVNRGVDHREIALCEPPGELLRVVTIVVNEQDFMH